MNDIKTLIDENNFEQSEYILFYSDKNLCLKKSGSKIGEISVDFLSTQFKNRLAKSTINNELIAKAVGIKSKNFNVFDATAGLGQDAFVLAYLGCNVTLCENNKTIWALLYDGLNRAKQHEAYSKITQRITLLNPNNSIIYLKNCTEKYDVIYLDPMFPPKKKNALPSKAMQYLSEIADYFDENELFEISMKNATKRVVVKRQRHSPYISNIKPDISFKSAACRFDVYFTTISIQPNHD
jgi:16S rRNA (guanine1516-N2)-methyltransferase